jgi:hypothetical protein
MPRRGRIPAAFLAHPPPSWRRRSRRNPLPIIGARSYARNPKSGFMMPWLLVGGAAFLFLTPSGRALAARFTGGAAVPSSFPAGTVRLADGTYRLPSGQIVGTPTGGTGSNLWMAPLTSLIPVTTGWLTSWLRGLSDTSSATTVGGTAPILDGGGGGVTMGTPDILSGAYDWSVGQPLPAIPDLTLASPGTSDFWSGIDTSGWWGNLGPVDPLAGPVPVLDFSLAALPDLPNLDAINEVSGFMGLGELHPNIKHRFRQPHSYR